MVGFLNVKLRGSGPVKAEGEEQSILSTARIVRRFTWKLLETKPKAHATLLEPAMNKNTERASRHSES